MSKTLEELAEGTPFEGLFDGNSIKPSKPSPEEQKHGYQIKLEGILTGDVLINQMVDLTPEAAQATAEAIKDVLQYITRTGGYSLAGADNVWRPKEEWRVGDLEWKIEAARNATNGEAL